MQLPFNIDNAVDGLAKVTLRGGVVGKITFAVVAVSLAIALIAWKVDNVWVSVGAGSMIFVLAFTVFWRLISFADRNPQAAILEGAEFVLHQQIVHAAKGVPSLPLRDIEQVQPEVIEGPAADPAIAQQPDQEIPALPPQAGGQH